MGHTLADFQITGKIPCLSDRLGIIAEGQDCAGTQYPTKKLGPQVLFFTSQIESSTS